MGAPWHRPEQHRGAFRAGALVGGYVIAERGLLVDGVRLPTGCIGEVIVHPDARMPRRRSGDDGVRPFAEGRLLLALLLLDGIADYYQKFGDADVFDTLWHSFDRERRGRSGRPPAGSEPRRPTTRRAAPTCKPRHVGAFDRTLEEMRWRLAGATTPPVVAVDGAGSCAATHCRPGAIGRSASARSRPTTGRPWRWRCCTTHAASSQSDELSWSIPPAAPLLFWLVDRLEVRSTRTYVPNGWWMARRPTGRGWSS